MQPRPFIIVELIGALANFPRLHSAGETRVYSRRKRKPPRRKRVQPTLKRLELRHFYFLRFMFFYADGEIVSSIGLSGFDVVAAAIACIAVAWVWFGHAPGRVENAVLVLCTFIATPYLQDYDLVLGTVAVPCLWPRPAPAASNRTLEISAGLLLLLPLIAASLPRLTGLALDPLFIAPLFVVALQMSTDARPADLATSAVSPGLNVR